MERRGEQRKHSPDLKTIFENKQHLKNRRLKIEITYYR